MLAPAFFLPPVTTTVLKATRILGPLVDKVYLYNPSGSDIHDAEARGLHPRCYLTPLNAPLNLLELSAMVRPMLTQITQPSLVIHARQDHTCPARKNLRYVMKHLASAEKRAIELEESYHVITVDSEKDQVANEVSDFVDRFRIVPESRAAG
jgi:carboxylesterase